VAVSFQELRNHANTLAAILDPKGSDWKTQYLHLRRSIFYLAQNSIRHRLTPMNIVHECVKRQLCPSVANEVAQTASSNEPKTPPSVTRFRDVTAIGSPQSYRNLSSSTRKAAREGYQKGAQGILSSGERNNLSSTVHRDPSTPSKPPRHSGLPSSQNQS
jgi:hypothetical protein